jgi:hypothetical protein
MKRGLVIAACIVAACASAHQSTGANDAPGGDAQVQHHDADTVLPHDAIPPLDAPGHHDATMQPHDAPGTPDAAIGGQLCTDNTGCPDTGTCCYFFICTPGAGVGSNLCFKS